MGRAARNAGGKAILYADKITDSMKCAIGETDGGARFRRVQPRARHYADDDHQTDRRDARDGLRSRLF